MHSMFLCNTLVSSSDSMYGLIIGRKGACEFAKLRTKYCNVV